MDKRTMAKAKSKKKERVIEVLILAFVIVSVGLLAVQIGQNVQDTLEQERNAEQLANGGLEPTPTPSGPTPTIDFSLPVQE